LRGIENNINKFNEAGIRVVAISVDTPEETRKHMVQGARYTFTFLSDLKLETIRRYDLVHVKEIVSGADIARPAEFLIDPSGMVRWRMVSDNFFKHALPEHLLEATNALP
jgi:peroxiredoxin